MEGVAFTERQRESLSRRGVVLDSLVNSIRSAGSVYETRALSSRRPLPTHQYCTNAPQYSCTGRDSYSRLALLETTPSHSCVLAMKTDSGRV